jgi:parallel beta-helix repeat protein
MNVWDNGYPSGGNYWSDYNGTDLCWGSEQNETGSDGIGDLPYIIVNGNRDNYPLIKPWVPYENGTIYIRADGSVDPSGAPILRKGDFYALKDNVRCDYHGIVIERDNMTLDGMGNAIQGIGTYNWQHAGFGIAMNTRANVTIENIEVESFFQGIAIYSSTNIGLIANSVNGSAYNGIAFFDSSNSCVVGNNVTNHWNYGIVLERCPDNTVTENNMTSNGGAIMLDSNSPGSGLFTTNNFVARNTMAYQNFGVSIFEPETSNNTIVFNDITKSYLDGIRLIAGSENVIAANNITESGILHPWPVGAGINFNSAYPASNIIYHNNFINKIQVLNHYAATSIWDGGYPCGGNYWSDYNGTDFYHGVYQNETGSDGIGDATFVIDSANQDNYPLMTPWMPPDLAATGATIAKTIIGQNYTGTGGLTFENQGNKIEAFNTSVYANSTVAYSEYIMLTMTNQTSGFVWNTTGFAYGNYTLSVCAEPLPGEIDVADNNFTCSIPVHVGIPGDISGPTHGVYDGTCNMRDIQYLILLFNTNPSSPNWKPNADINDDGTVNMRDIQIAILNFNRHE